MRAVVLVRVDAAAPVVSPAYDTGASEEAIVRRWRDHHLGLAEARLAEDGAEDSSRSLRAPWQAAVMVGRVEYDEFGLFHENAAEFGLPYDGPPVVRRASVEVAPGGA